MDLVVKELWKIIFSQVSFQQIHKSMNMVWNTDLLQDNYIQLPGISPQRVKMDNLLFKFLWIWLLTKSLLKINKLRNTIDWQLNLKKMWILTISLNSFNTIGITRLPHGKSLNHGSIICLIILTIMKLTYHQKQVRSTKFQSGQSFQNHTTEKLLDLTRVIWFLMVDLDNHQQECFWFQKELRALVFLVSKNQTIILQLDLMVLYHLLTSSSEQNKLWFTHK